MNKNKTNNNKPYIYLDDGTIWPNPDNDLAYLLRYGTKEQIYERRLLIASIVSAYRDLIFKTQKRRNDVCGKIKDEIKEWLLYK